MKMLLAGQWVDREKTIDVCDPFDDNLIDTVPAATAEDVETAVATAHAARAAARALTAYERSQILLKTAAMLSSGSAKNSSILAISVTSMSMKQKPVISR